MTSPLIYGEDGDNLVLVASYGGAPTRPVWWPNLKAHPDTTVNVNGDVRRVRARQATPPRRRASGRRWWRCMRRMRTTSARPSATSRS